MYLYLYLNLYLYWLFVVFKGLSLFGHLMPTFTSFLFLLFYFVVFECIWSSAHLDILRQFSHTWLMCHPPPSWNCSWPLRDGDANVWSVNNANDCENNNYQWTVVNYALDSDSHSSLLRLTRILVKNYELDSEPGLVFRLIAECQLQRLCPNIGFIWFHTLRAQHLFLQRAFSHY